MAVVNIVSGEGVETPDPGRLQARERRRLESMFREHHLFIWRVLRRHGLSPEGAADASQQVFLVASQRIGDIKLGSERSFLLGTALRLARAALRNNRRWQLETDMDHIRSGAAAAEEHAWRRQLLGLADRALGELGPDLLTVFVLFELEGVAMREIAEIVDIPLGTVASRLRRARTAFRAAVARLETGKDQEAAS